MKANKILPTLFVLMISSQLSFAQNITADTTLANSYFETAQEYNKNKSYDTAIVYFEKASTLYLEHELWRKYLQSKTKHGKCLQKQWQLDKAIATIKPAIEKTLLHINKNDVIVADAYHSLGMQYYYQSKNDSTLFYWKKALKIRKELFGEKHIDIAKNYNNVGIVYNNKNKYDLALQYYFKSLQIYKELLGEKHTLVAMSYNNIGNVYAKKNEHDLALQYYFKSLQIHKELLGEKHNYVTASYNNIGNIYKDKNEYDLALQYYFKSLQIKKELLGEKHTDVAGSYNNIGIVYNIKNEYNLALECHFKVLKIYKELLGEKHTLVAMSNHNIGVVYKNKNEYDLALQYYFKALQIKRELLGEKHIDVAHSYNNIGIVYRDKNENDLALQYYQKGIASSLRNFNDTVNVYSVPIIKDYLNWDRLLGALQAKAKIFADSSLTLSNLDVALRHYQACDTLISQVRQSINTKSDKLALGEQASEVYKGAVNVCLRLAESSDDFKSSDDYRELAFYFSEKNKSSVLLEALAGVEAQKFAEIPDTLLTKEHKLQIDIALYKKILAEQPDSAKEILFRDKLFKANRQYDELIYTFENEYPEYFELKYNRKPASVNEIQKILDNKTAIISYFTGDSIITIFTITKKNLDAKTVPAIENLADTIRDFRNGLLYTNSSRFAEVYKKYAYKMYRQLIPENVNNEITNLIIIPDAELSMIPFETLLTENPEDKEWKELPYLVKKYNISYSYSANLFYKTFPKELTTKIEHTDLNDWLAFAPVFDDSNTAGLTLRTRELLQKFDTDLNDTLETRGRLVSGGYISPLPGTESEVQAIFKQFDERGKKALVQIKKSANEEFIKQGGLEKYRIIHFATHGFVNTTKPELSGIFLAQDSTLNEDGILYSGEIYNLKLNADLTVLSACETGLGEIKKGEGLIGLTRALLYAGSKNIIVSLWKVADNSTSDLMIDFYKNLLEEEQEKQEFSQALQHAKLKMIDEGEYAHPFYWSPFILIGK
ncbi:MAG: CHAT domain-containing protein [Bacteroidales bacterium]|nr:CHAT domain-containing protein [Bacteroidales bacterium]